MGRLTTKKGVQLWAKEEKGIRQPERIRLEEQIRQAAPTRSTLWRLLFV